MRTFSPYLAVALAVSATLAPRAAGANPFTLLHQYLIPLPEPGCQPESTLVETSTGVFYGTTANCSPTLFKVTSAGVYTMLAFVNTNSFPVGALLHASNGLLYGVTASGGIFRSDLAGNMTTLAAGYGFDGLGYPLIEDVSGTIYGIAGDGDSSTYFLFKMTLDGAMTAFHQFTVAENVPTGGVIQASDGNLYGATRFGVYRVTPDGALTMIHLFDANNEPYGKLTQGAGGKLYGVLQGYPNAIYSLNLNGSGYTVVNVGTDGYSGMTTGLAASGIGVLFGGTNLDGKGGGRLYAFITPSSIRTIVTWPARQLNAPVTPSDGVVIGSDGRLYGTLSSAGTGASDLGGIYSLDAGLTPPSPRIFNFAPTTGSSGIPVLIQGIHFLGAMAVTFNGSQSAFQVDSDGFITANVPAGATSGPIQVTTANGSTVSIRPFTVQ